MCIRDRYMIVIDFKECRQLRYNIDNDKLQATFHPTPPIDEERNPVSIEDNMCSYNLKDNILYILMPQQGNFVIVKSKKKKHLNEFSGKLPKKRTNLLGLHGWFLEEKAILIYYDSNAVYQWKVPHEYKFRIVPKESVQVTKSLIKFKQERRVRQKAKQMHKKRHHTLVRIKNSIAMEEEEELDEENEELKEQIESTMRGGLDSMLVRMEKNLKSAFQAQPLLNGTGTGIDYVLFCLYKTRCRCCRCCRRECRRQAIVLSPC
eukprot:TRINITY_DN4888_c0_g1_i2.p1 TRINITY_DN4888_c0_g1~~TRINITY_DN4888_c0_g1_i2.p1  ORF type:complete len:277 (-),score=49.54 TRINITY_DN4888_c0_g1_i2:84-869(-)